MLDEFFCAFARASDCAREAAEHQLFVSLQTACGAAWLSSVELWFITVNPEWTK